MSVYRCYTEKRPGFAVHAAQTLSELREQLGLKALKGLRILHRYDVEGIDRETFDRAALTVFSEPMCDTFREEEMPAIKGEHAVLAVESLPGQFDQRADSCAQCIQLLAGCDRPRVRCATVYVLQGKLEESQVQQVADYLINPVECRRAGEDKPDTLEQVYTQPQTVAVIEGFTALDQQGLSELRSSYGLAMDLDDLVFLQGYFRDEEHRDPTVTEVRVVDTYWSDHCRHTTFSTHIDSADIQHPGVERSYAAYLAGREEVYGPERAAQRPQTLMDIATAGTKVLKGRGLLPNLDESEEINACSIHIPVNVDGEEQDWLLQFKNETHNHPTEIEPFGGAATCIGGAIRDPLAGRAYVYQAMRLTGCGDPRAPISDTIPGRLPQRKLAVTAAAGYSSYGNQIGLATGMVSEFYHPGYVAKHMELGAVVGAVPSAQVVREQPQAGDVVLLLGGRTGRDGIGGATGSSKSHTMDSLQTMGSEVQKGNAPEERKLQRLFRNPEVTSLIKRCNDFGAGGVSVAIGELADGLEIDLNAVRKKYEGLDGTELAISESQERMAVCVAPENAERMIAFATAENLEAYPVAVVTEQPRMVMRWNGQTVANLSRAFLNTNGADKHTSVSVPAPAKQKRKKLRSFERAMKEMAKNPAYASQRGLGERFDSTIGAGSVLSPFGGRYQTTPAQVMAGLLPVGPGKSTDTCSVMAWGFDPMRMEADPYSGAYAAVVDSVAKLAAAGADPEGAYLTLQEYFQRLGEDASAWGKPFAALLGAYQAQIDLGCAAIGGKDSMSGSFLDRNVPPTLVSFAIAPARAGDIISDEFKAAGHPVCLFTAPDNDPAALRAMWARYLDLARAGKVCAAWAVSAGGAAEGVMKMSFGNRIGFAAETNLETLFAPRSGAILAELTEAVEGVTLLGYTTAEPVLSAAGESVSLKELQKLWEGTLEDVYPTQAPAREKAAAYFTCSVRPQHGPAVKVARPRAVIPVFPGTNCEYDTANACLRAGIEPDVRVIRNLTTDQLLASEQEVAQAIANAQMVILPGGFSGGDEPEGSGKFIASFFRNARIRDEVHNLLRNRDGLMLGICNGFQALVKLGLVPYGEIRDMTDKDPTLTFNLIGRHQSRYVPTRVASVKSPWMLLSNPGDVYTVPISHGEGRFVAPIPVLEQLVRNGQVATQYVDLTGRPSMDVAFNPNGSACAIEGIFSPDGRVFGKMGHSERWNPGIARNITGELDMPLFRSGALYFK